MKNEESTAPQRPSPATSPVTLVRYMRQEATVHVPDRWKGTADYAERVLALADEAEFSDDLDYTPDPTLWD